MLRKAVDGTEYAPCNTLSESVGRWRQFVITEGAKKRGPLPSGPPYSVPTWLLRHYTFFDNARSRESAPPPLMISAMPIAIASR